MDVVCLVGPVSGLVELEGLLPCGAGGPGLTVRELGVGKAAEGVGLGVGMAEVVVQGEGVPVVVQCFGESAGVVGDVAEAVEGVCFAFAVLVLVM